MEESVWIFSADHICILHWRCDSPFCAGGGDCWRVTRLTPGLCCWQTEESQVCWSAALLWSDRFISACYKWNAVLKQQWNVFMDYLCVQEATAQRRCGGIAGSWDAFLVSTLWINNSFPDNLYKRWLLAAGPACPLTVSWVNPPDSHCSIMVHLSGRGHGRRLSHSLQIKSTSDPSWASCLQGSFGSVRTTLCGIH